MRSPRGAGQARHGAMRIFFWPYLILNTDAYLCPYCHQAHKPSQHNHGAAKSSFATIDHQHGLLPVSVPVDKVLKDAARKLHAESTDPTKQEMAKQQEQEVTSFLPQAERLRDKIDNTKAVIEDNLKRQDKMLSN